MARTESKIIMGYLPIETKHHAAIRSLVEPRIPAHRLMESGDYGRVESGDY